MRGRSNHSGLLSIDSVESQTSLSTQDASTQPSLTDDGMSPETSLSTHAGQSSKTKQPRAKRPNVDALSRPSKALNAGQGRTPAWLVEPTGTDIEHNLLDGLERLASPPPLLSAQDLNGRARSHTEDVGHHQLIQNSHQTALANHYVAEPLTFSAVSSSGMVLSDIDVIARQREMSHQSRAFLQPFPSPPNYSTFALPKEGFGDQSFTELTGPPAYRPSPVAHSPTRYDDSFLSIPSIHGASRSFAHDNALRLPSVGRVIPSVDLPGWGVTARPIFASPLHISDTGTGHPDRDQPAYAPSHQLFKRCEALAALLPGTGIREILLRDAPQGLDSPQDQINRLDELGALNGQTLALYVNLAVREISLTRSLMDPAGLAPRSSIMTLSVFADPHHWPILQSLNLASVPLHDHDLTFIHHLPALRTLNLSSTGISPEGITHLTALKANLKELSLCENAQINDDVWLMLSYLSALVSLSLDGTHVTMVGLRKYVRGLIKEQRNVSMTVPAEIYDYLDSAEDLYPDCSQKPMCNKVSRVAKLSGPEIKLNLVTHRGLDSSIILGGLRADQDARLRAILERRDADLACLAYFHMLRKPENYDDEGSPVSA
ncbi:uncharacterized protein L969DRAFT_174413 [Mixia osmundae IAM 14324]|uniref:RNI-like protein n=1 Tax=Mixia osmundae (strain CBS 9802 / IAM 14324 / JCM 22182 / KY 12970) TaxID=764103 RepID=G7DTN5_MIXOS|nr:uncharacterized protein L969DRAFT_174413 [Mixia osmundae IAM 14324]KEI42784.1 hypothetical protein L969DRAFT_174413 [Mixia osmundae IAM 14324]GAA93882.1 hypothetical protein E5Q_00528 [Mixia osmundae IAM 14324]